MRTRRLIRLVSLPASINSLVTAFSAFGWLAVGTLYWSTRDQVRHWDAVRLLDPSSFVVLVIVAAKLAAGLSLCAMLVRDLRQRHKRQHFEWIGSICTFLAVMLAALCATTLLDIGFPQRRDEALLHDVFFTVVCAGMALGLLLQPRGERRHAAGLGGSQVIVVNLALALVLAEGTLVVWARVHPSVLFMDQASAERRLEANRNPGHVYFGYPFNSGGYHDEPFFIAGEGDVLVAVIGDSFGTGVVPYPYNFVTRLESQLKQSLETVSGRVAAHNFALPSIGMPEYAHLLETEVLETRPALVVLSVFVGNDLDELEAYLPKRDRLRYSLIDWYVYQVPRRLWRLARELLKRDGGGVLHVGEVPPDGTQRQADAANEVALIIPDYVDDASLEPPTFSVDGFMEIERYRAEVCHVGREETEQNYSAFFRVLADFDEKLGERLIVLLIPDEFQVNDALWAQILADKAHPERYVRNLPQQRVAEFAQVHGLTVVDALPALRQAEAGGRTYHLRDTHLNARGNQVVADVLTGAVITSLKSLEINTQTALTPSVLNAQKQ